MDNNYMSEWKKGSIRIGAPTNLLAAATAFIPVIWLCMTYDCWPTSIWCSPAGPWWLCPSVRSM